MYGQLFILIFCYFSCGFSKDLQVRLNAKSAILINKETGKILYEKNAHDKFFPASTTKIATALFILEKVSDLNQYTLPTKEALETIQAEKKHANYLYSSPHILEHDGSMMTGISSKRSISLRDLLYGLMLVSGNNAANVLAEAVSGEIPLFMEELNFFLKEKGCKNTTLFNPHGLHYPGHFSTAYDLAFLTKLALENELFREIVSSLKYKPEFYLSELKQANQLLCPEKKYYYPKAIGVKTGYTEKAGYNLVSAAEDENRKLIGVVLGCEKKKDRYLDMIKLFDAAFLETKEQRRFFSKNQIFEKSIVGAKQPIIAKINEDVDVWYYLSEDPDFKAFIEWGDLSLPIKTGQIVGNIVIKDDAQELVRTQMYSENNVEKTFLRWLKDLLL